MNDPKLPPMVGTLSTLPEHVQEVVKSYARAAIAINRRAAATPSAPTAVEPDERAMANELIKVAAWLLSPEPRRKLAELEDATHIGHRQFHRAYEGTFETLRLKAIEIRNFVDAARASKGEKS